MHFNLKVWRQKNPTSIGGLESYNVKDILPEMSFLEVLDVVNQELIKKGKDPIAFDHDCREGICGSCGMFINGRAHGPLKGITTCQLYMRNFKDGDTITVEPFRASAFPIVKDLIVDRSAFDRIIIAGGYISVNTAGAPDANAIPISKEAAESAFEASECIGCGACVAACVNASAVLFVGAKISHLARLPQGRPERKKRVLAMVEQMDKEGFGACSNTEACSAECPKAIGHEVIAQLRREYYRAKLLNEK